MKKTIILIGMVLQGLIYSSCNQWLDVKPSGEIEREDLYNTEDGYYTALAGCYIKLKGNTLYGQALTMTTVEYLAQHWQTKAEQVEDFMDFNWKSDYAKGQMASIFSEMYNVINQLNDLLAQMKLRGEEVIPEKELRYLVQGEALALRAFCHFDILRLFGPSPVDPDRASVQLPYSEKSGEKIVPYYSYEVYTEKLFNDLNRADSLLKAVDLVRELTFEELNEPSRLVDKNVLLNDFQSYRRTRLNYWALQAFEARVALYFGDKPAAWEHARAVLEARVKGLPVGDITLFKQNTNDAWYTLPSETLFALNSFDLIDKVQSIFRETRMVLYNFETEAELREKLFENQNSDFRLSLWTDMSYQEQRQMGLKKYWQQDEEEVKEAITYGQQIPMLRMAEVYLIAAEAAPSLAEGNAKLDALRASRGLLAKSCATIEELNGEILKEYQKEFYAEGQMFFTYKRIGAKSMRWNEGREINVSEYRIPVPETEFTYE